jgi:hypothetical protein
MLTEQVQDDVLPRTFTQFTTDSMNAMRLEWAEAWRIKHKITRRAEQEVLRELAFRVNQEKGVAYLMQKTLARDLWHPVKEDTVYRAIKRLASIGAIEILKGTDRHPDFWSGDMNNYRVRFDRVPTDDGGWVTTSLYVDMLKPKPIEEPVEGRGNVVTRECPTNVTPAHAEISTETPSVRVESGSNPGPIRTQAVQALQAVEAVAVGSTSYFPARSELQADSETQVGEEIRGSTDTTPAVGGSPVDVASPKSSASDSTGNASVRRSKPRSNPFGPDWALGPKPYP